MENLKKKAEAKEVIFGTHVFIGDLAITECMAKVGYDAIWLDMEHTAIDKEKVLTNLIAAKAGGTPVFVRIPWNDPVLAKPILDMGPDGIIFPYIRSAEDAKNAVCACDYPLSGVRGYGPLRALSYGLDNALEYVTNNYRKTWRILQIEHIDAVNNLEEIVAVEGIDAYLVGPNDLAASMGHLGHVDHPEVIAVCDKIAEIMNKHGKVFGVSTVNREDVIRQWLDRDAKMIFAGTDIDYVCSGAVNNLKFLKGLI